MKAWSSDPRKVPRRLRELGFEVVEEKKRATVFERGGERVALPRIFRDHRALENWLHSNKAKLGGGDGQSV